MAGPYSMDRVFDIPLDSDESLLSKKRGRVLPEASRVKVYANRETVDVTFGITVGEIEALAAGAGAAINAVAGDVPSTRDDLILDTFGNQGDEILILATNKDAAAAREARVIVFVTPIDDNALQNAMDMLGV